MKATKIGEIVEAIFIDNGTVNVVGSDSSFTISQAQFCREYLVIPSGAGMNFGGALVCLRREMKVARRGWNGKGMYIYLMSGLCLEPEQVNERTRKCIGEGVPLDSQPYIAMKNAQGQWQPGWLASQADILAEDWEVVS